MTVKKVNVTRVFAMAFNRREFKDRVAEYIGGALLESYKAALARKNGYTKWTVHWDTEVRQLLSTALVSALLRPIRGFKDKRKAIIEAIDSIKSRDASYRVAATNQILRDFKVRKLKKQLDDSDTNAFWAKAFDTINESLIDSASV